MTARGGSSQHRCEDCEHFRPRRQLTEMLSLPMSLGTANAASTIMRTEQELIGAEEGRKFALTTTREERWGSTRPRVLAHCGLRETAGEYLVCEQKNADGRCADFKQDSVGDRHQCRTCVHRRAATGPARDGRILLELLQPRTFVMPDVQRSYSSPNEDIDLVTRVTGTNHSDEALAALHSDGVLPRPPGYFSWCAEYSGANGYVVCSMQNPHGRCHGWSDGSREPDRQANRQRTPTGDAPSVQGPEASSRPAGPTPARSTFFRDAARLLAAELTRDRRSRP